MIELTTVVTLKSNTSLSTNMDGEIVILDTANGKYFGLDGVGARIWEILQTPQSVDQLKSTILQEYDVSEQQCEQDLIDLLDGLNKAGLVTLS